MSEPLWNKTNLVTIRYFFKVVKYGSCKTAVESKGQEWRALYRESREMEFTMRSIKLIDVKTGKVSFGRVIHGIMTIKQQCTGEYKNWSNRILSTDSNFQRQGNGTRNFIMKCSKQENNVKRFHVLKWGQICSMKIG